MSVQNKWKLFLMVASLMILLIACVGGEPADSGETTEVETAEVTDDNESEESDEPEEEPEPIIPPTLTILADGEIKLGRPTLPLSFEASGKLVALNVSVGDVVSAGDVIATLDDQALQEAVTSAELRLALTQNSLAQAEFELQKLVDWEPDDSAIAIAEANITSAEANLQSAQNQDAAAGNRLTSSQVNIDQANRELADAQEQYDNAYSEGRLWEEQYDALVCEVIGGFEQCLNITYAERLKNDREFATARLQNAQEQLRIARANYALEASNLSNSSTVGAESGLVAAEQELVRALKAPTADDINTARLNVTQAELSLAQEEFTLQQAQEALADSQLVAPWSGTILSVDAVEGATIGAGTPVVTLVDTAGLEFHTTNLSERDLDEIEIGQVAEVTLKTYPNEPFSGVVTRIEFQANGVVGDAAVFPVVVTLDETDQAVRVGMTGRVEISRE